MKCRYCDHCVSIEAEYTERRFHDRHYCPRGSATYQRMVRIGDAVAPLDFESMDKYLERIWELAK